MTNKLLPIIRIILLVLAVGFILTIAYKYLVNGTFDALMLTPIIGLLFFYFITKPKEL